MSAPSEPIDILVVTRKLDLGGTEGHLAQVLPRLNHRRFRARVFALYPGGCLEGRMRDAGVPVLGAPPALPPGARRVAAAARLLAHMMFGRPAVVHFFLPEAYLVGGLCALVTRREVRVMSRRSLNAYQRKHPILARVERWLHHRMTAVIGNSQAVVDELADEGVADTRLGLIYNGIDLEPFDDLPRRGEIRAALGLADDALVLVTVANLIPYKGHGDLLQALAGVRDDLPDGWLLLCAGRDDGMGGALKAEAVALGLGGHVRWLGEHRDVPALLRAADIGVLCSREEGFSNTVLEGMAAGLAMVVTDVGGNREAVVDGATGVVVALRDSLALGRAILALARDPRRRRAMGAAGRRRVEATFPIAACVARYERLYLGLLDRPGKPVAEILGPPPRAVACAGPRRGVGGG